jgi:RNA polymerase sigma-32 factor
MRKYGRDMVGLKPETAAAIAEDLKVTPRDVIEMDVRLNGDLSLSTPVHDDGLTADWEAMLVDDSPNVETVVAEHDERTRQGDALRVAMDVLSERERHVFEARRLSENPPTLEQLGRKMSISGERVRQIEVRAFDKVKRAATQHLKSGNSPGLVPTQLELVERSRNQHRQRGPRPQWQNKVKI